MDKVRIEINRSTRDAIKESGAMHDTYDTLLCEMCRVYALYKIATDKKRKDVGA